MSMTETAGGRERVERNRQSHRLLYLFRFRRPAPSFATLRASVLR
jgi:hypothetical protein